MTRLPVVLLAISLFAISLFAASAAARADQQRLKTRYNQNYGNYYDYYAYAYPYENLQAPNVYWYGGGFYGRKLGRPGALQRSMPLGQADGSRR
jgi:hypothetical protein